MPPSLFMSCKQGKLAQYSIAKVVHYMFKDVWVYRPSIGWRVRVEEHGSMGSLLVGEDAELYISQKLSEDVADLYENYARANPGIYENNAKDIVIHLKNRNYKKEIVEEAQALFMDR